MSDETDRTHQDRPRADNRSGDFQEAVNRLEQALQEVLGSAKGQFADRATMLIDETTARLKREFGARRDSAGDGGRTNYSQAARRASREPGRMQGRPRTRRLYRDPAHQKIGGVCAGIANYYGVDIWVVRLIAVTGLLFLPSIVFPAYWIAYFLMDKPPERDTGGPREHSGSRRNHSSPAPELGARLSPRNSLRNVSADLAEAELRLRRMETHVTSGQYELQRELHKIDVAG